MKSTYKTNRKCLNCGKTIVDDEHAERMRTSKLINYYERNYVEPGQLNYR